MGLVLNQYDVVVVNLDPTIGGELRKTRPCVILSPDEMNKYLKTIIIAPITSKSKSYPTRVVIELREKENWVVIDQIRTIDKRRIYKKMGQLKPVEIQKVRAVIQETLVD